MSCDVCVVIGGSGFLGRNLVALLVSKGYKVRIFDLAPPKEHLDNVEFLSGSLLVKSDLRRCLKEDVSAVFLLASPPPLSQEEKLFIKVNLFGAKNVIDICKEAKIKKLILTSSASVVFDPFHDVVNGDETLPYALNSVDAYTKSKIMQEMAVLEANCDEMATVAIRPHGIFGPGDQIFPTVKKNCASIKKMFMIGSGNNVVDFTYVDNVSHAHVLAMEKLEPNNILAGKAYNVTNDEPIFFWDFMGDIMGCYGSNKPSIGIPLVFMLFVAIFMHFLRQILMPVYNLKTSLTPMIVSLAGKHHYYSCERAKRELGYVPIVSLREGFQQTKDYHGLG